MTETKSAFVLISCDSELSYLIKNELEKLPIVKKLVITNGTYQIMATLESDSQQLIKDVVTWKIRRINGINSTLTLFKVR